MLAQREHDYFAETVICANCYIVAKKEGPFLVSQITEVLFVFLFSY